MAIWRLQVNTSSANIAEYCIEHHVAAMGWGLFKTSEELRKSVKTFSDYEKLAKIEYGTFDSVKRLHNDVKESDIIWMRDENRGKYFFARVKSSSRWVFNLDAGNIDATNQLTDIDWYPASDMADEESVPGAITTAFIARATLQRIKKDGIETYSQLLYNKVHDENLDPFRYPSPEPPLSLCESHFYSMLQPQDIEDLLAIWLYDKKKYICIPSTNKLGTPLYECVLVDPNDFNRKHIYIQAKKGRKNINADEYSDLRGEIYLLTTEGKVENEDKYDNIISVNPSEIFQFATDPNKAHIIPENVLYWIKFLTDLENERIELMGGKGIMFDTNRSYSLTNENEMLICNKVSAYGDASRFVDRFNAGDYVLFYSKGKGIIAIGRVISEIPTTIGNEKYHDVEMVVPKGYDGDITRIKAINPSEIKKILGRNFYWASTIKTPYLSIEQTKLLINNLEKKYR